MANQIKGISLFTCCFVIFSFCSFADAADYFRVKLEAVKTELTIGEETKLEVWGMADGATTSNGIGSWQVDLTADSGLTGGVVEALNYNIHEPLGWMIGVNPPSLNDPGNGDVDILGAFTFQTTSETGVGDYSKLADITIKAVALGTITYSATPEGTPEFACGLVGGAPLDGLFETGPYNVITVIPEPCSLALWAIMGGWVASRRRTKRNR